MDIFIDKMSFDFLTNQKILKLISQIDQYKGKWNSYEKQENIYLKELRRIATVESIGSSTRIEGSTMNDKEIRALLKDIKITKLKTRDEQEVIGYFDTLELIYKHHGDIVLSENYIKQLHQMLLKYSDKDSRHRGRYKSLSNKVVANYPDGIKKIIFNTTDVHLVSGEMDNLLAWTNQQLKDKTLHTLVVLAHFIYEFLSIHPFQDGNGRLSRLLTTLLLLQNEYFFIQYVSFENQIESTKKEYYEALMDGQKNRGNQNENMAKWLLYFLESLLILTQKLDAKYDVFKQKGGYLNERQLAIKNYLLQNQPLKVSDFADAFADISINTIKKDLQYMRNEKIIKTVGRGRGTVYVMFEE